MNLISDDEDDICWEEERQIQEAFDASMDNQSSETITRYYSCKKYVYGVYNFYKHITSGITIVASVYCVFIFRSDGATNPSLAETLNLHRDQYLHQDKSKVYRITV